MPSRGVLSLALILLPIAAGAQPERAVAAASEWVREVERHRPGAMDAAAETVSGWTTDKFELVRRGLRKYIFVQRWNDPERENRVYQRGALLHTDIALLAPSRARLFLGPGSEYTSVTLALDGERRDAETVTGHWAFARTLLDEVKPNPSRDDVVRRWYVAVAAHLELHALLGVASPHLARAQQVLGDDPDILFFTGAMHETFASPRSRRSRAASARPSMSAPASILPGSSP